MDRRQARGALRSPDDLALDDILELERRWKAGARTLLTLGFPWAEVALDLSRAGSRVGRTYWCEMPADARPGRDRSHW